MKFVDLTGQRFGKLLVVSRGPNGGNRQPRWVCHCDCSKTVVVYGSSLRGGVTKSCGCSRSTSRIINRIGRRYGRYVVRKESGRIGKKIALEVVCDCGQVRRVTASNLVSGRARSCGCLMREINRSRRGDKHPSWKGGSYITPSGYRRVKCAGHPNADVNGYVAADRLAMSNHLGRPLRDNETVHHRKSKLNDKIDNLQLRASRHEPGHSVEEFIEWSLENIEMYGPELSKLGLSRFLGRISALSGICK